MLLRMPSGGNRSEQKRRKLRCPAALSHDFFSRRTPRFPVNVWRPAFVSNSGGQRRTLVMKSVKGWLVTGATLLMLTVPMAAHAYDWDGGWRHRDIARD